LNTFQRPTGSAFRYAARAKKKAGAVGEYTILAASGEMFQAKVFANFIAVIVGY
jgi:hypothetical protein